MNLIKCNIKYINLLVLLLVLLRNQGFSQNAQFSQAYAIPVLLSPSFTGMVEGSRVSVGYRDQWPNLPGTFVTYALAYDQYFEQWRSGFGAIILRDQAGDGHLSLTNFGLLYSFDFQANDVIHIRPGMQFLYSERGINYDNLVFGDQIIDDGGSYTIAGSTIEMFDVSRKRYPDVHSSLMVYTSKYWGGFTWEHMLRPNYSLIGDVSKMPYKFSFYGGARFNLRKSNNRYLEEDITVTAIYRKQSNWNQFDIGLYYTKTPIILGLYFRGVPFKSSFNRFYQSRDAAIVMVGYKIYALRLGYSYDITISSLEGYTGGTHEVSLSYEFNYNIKLRVKQKREPVPCPKF